MPRTAFRVAFPVIHLDCVFERVDCQHDRNAAASLGVAFAASELVPEQFGQRFH
jgi:hypothetical protein